MVALVICLSVCLVVAVAVACEIYLNAKNAHSASVDQACELHATIERLHAKIGDMVDQRDALEEERDTWKRMFQNTVNGFTKSWKRCDALREDLKATADRANRLESELVELGLEVEKFDA